MLDNFLCFRKDKCFLTHIGLTFLIPLFISIIIFMSQLSFATYRDAKFYEILWYLTCCIPMLISFIILFLLVDIAPYIIVLSSIIIRLLFLLLFIFLHNENKKLGIISDTVFVVVNIFFGSFFLAIKCL
jgi:hypothetical protein